MLLRLSLVALTSAAVTVGMLYTLDLRRAQQAANLKAENDRLRLEIVRNHERRSVADRTGARLANTGAPQGPSTNQSSPAGETVLSDYRREGTSNPVSALQTFAWAGDRGDVATIKEMITFDSSAREKAARFFESLPADARQEFRTLEDLAAAELSAQMIRSPFPRADMITRATLEPERDDRVTVWLLGTTREKSVFERQGESWRYVITKEMVDAFLDERAAR